ncbi:hypothetical protein DVH05_000891 [Phytophthora capsici]|nr:hypothetical protein DVH05_000891 [Phytophthora capsici]
MSSQEPPSKKQKMLKTDEERDGTLILEEKPLPLMDAEEVESTLEGVKVVCSEASQVGELPSLSFVDDYDLGQYYYIRECYDEYYILVKEMLDNERKCVTVTGTPGGVLVSNGRFSCKKENGFCAASAVQDVVRTVST